MREQKEEERDMITDWRKRRSGAMFRGQCKVDSLKPDGKGIKIFKGKSLYEGHFQDGQYNGYGRAISSLGEIYQGEFE